MPIKRSAQAQRLRTKTSRKLSTTKQVETKRGRVGGSVERHFGQPEGNPINKEAQFGEPNGNPRHNGAWKKEDALRFKLQQIAKMSRAEIEAGLAEGDPNHLEWGEYERQVGQALLDMQSVPEPEKRLGVLFDLTNQDSGNPRQQIEQTNLEAPIPLSPRKIITEPEVKPATPPTKPHPKPKRKSAKRKKK